MTQTLISAPPRTGKSQYSVYLIDQFSKKYPNRQIFTNIIGINYPGVISISSTINRPFDWRDLPNGAILFYDECHEHPAFSDDDLLKHFQPDLSKLDMISSLVDANKIDYRVFPIIDDYYDDLYFKEMVNGIALTLPDEKKIAAQYFVQHGKLPDFLKKGLSEYLPKLKKKETVRQKENILDIGRTLTMHGHFGIDIFMITQNVKRVNDAVKAASSKHLVLRRMFGWDMCFIFEYIEVQTYFAASNRKNATRFSVFRYKKNLYKYYVSSEEHNIQKSMPVGLVMLFLFVFCIFALAFYKGKNLYDTKYSDKKPELVQKQDAGSAQNTSPVNNPNQQNSTSQQTASQPVKPLQLSDSDKYHLQSLIDSCVNSQQMAAEQCKDIYDLNKKQAVAMNNFDNGMQQNAPLYDSSNPYDYEYNVAKMPTDAPMLSNTVIYNGKCYAYSQQGTLMQNIKDSDCRRFASGDRPFNYFRQQSFNAQPALTANTLPASDAKTDQSMTAEDIAKYQEAKRQGLI